MKNILAITLAHFLLSNTAMAQLKATETEVLLHILVTDMGSTIRPHEWVQFEGVNSQKNYEAIADDKGKFDILLPEGDTYIVRVKGWGNQEEFTRIELASEKGSVEGNLKLQYEPEKSFTLENVHFHTAKSTLKPESFPTLDELAKVLTLQKNLRLEIAGHTDDVGDDASNLKLSEARAKSVVQYLIQKGIDAKRLIPKGYGETQPVADNSTPEGKQLNRRTEAHILENTTN